MTSNQFARVKALLLEVADLSESERRAHLDEVCRDDPDLRREVEKILAHGDDPTGILKTGAIAPKRTPSTTPDSTDLPDKIAGYRIVRLLGEGGMGVVYEAEQQSPRRPVALKVIRGGAYVDEHHVRLFQREAQALGRLKHPGIAAIYESGRTEDGQHFFAMELVRGVPLDEYLKKHPIEGGRSKESIRQRLDLFLQICDAISYAHQRGVIHRDLKPGNILVMSGSSGSRPGTGTNHSQVKILDFGLARMTDADVAVTTMVTEVGKIQGTLAYMSPEQARGNPDEIDIRSDVYSLGVLLYEMLTGVLPYDVRRTMIHEAVRVICEEEPARPSTIERTLRGDLETIALKALEKEPGRRYQSVSALSEDIDRYLTDQPILARPPSATYQLRKLVNRHQSQAIFVGSVIVVLLVLGITLAVFGFMAVLVVILAGFAITMSVMFGAQRAERMRADRERSRAVREVETTALVTSTLEGMLSSVDPTKSGRDVTVREMLDETAKTLGEKFKDKPLVEARLRHTVGRTYFALGESTAEKHLRRTLDLRREHLGSEDLGTLEALDDLAWLNIRRRCAEAAEPLAREALETSRLLLGKEHPRTLRAMHTQGVVYGSQGRSEEARALYQAALEICRRVLGEEHPQTLDEMSSLGVWCLNFGSPDEAETRLRETLAIKRRVFGEEHPNTLFNMMNLALAYEKLNRHEEAEVLFREALEIRLRVLGEEHPQTADSMFQLAVLLLRQGRYDEAEALNRRTLEIRRRVLGEDNVQTNDVRYDLGCSLAMQGRSSEATSLLQDALDNGYDFRDNWWSWTLDDPRLASLHADPEFEAIVEELRRRNEGAEQ